MFDLFSRLQGTIPMLEAESLEMDLSVEAYSTGAQVQRGGVHKNFPYSREAFLLTCAVFKASCCFYLEGVETKETLRCIFWCC
jgi:hypothetical protein